VSGGRVVLLAGLLLHAYETYSTIPVLQSGAESIAAALFYFASGALFAAPALDRARVRNTDLRTRPSLDHDPQD
jgi:hypothetical protein